MRIKTKQHVPICANESFENTGIESERAYIRLMLISCKYLPFESSETQSLFRGRLKTFQILGKHQLKGRLLVEVS